MKPQYAAWSSDEDNLRNSSSGGVFFELAKEMIRQGGMVVGVVITADIKTKYIITGKIEAVKAMRGSKYMASNPSNILPYLKKWPSPVLVCGLPCHIERIKRECDTSKMVLVDVKCHGVPKSKIFSDHLDNIAAGREIVSIKFRDKSAGWDDGPISQTLIVEFADGTTYEGFEDYMKPYLNGDKCLREGCKRCELSCVGDITLADFWNVPPKFRNRMGTSHVTTNTQKGDDFFTECCMDSPVRDGIIAQRVCWYDYLNGENIGWWLMYHALRHRWNGDNEA